MNTHVHPAVTITLDASTVPLTSTQYVIAVVRQPPYYRRKVVLMLLVTWEQRQTIGHDAIFTAATMGVPERVMHQHCIAIPTYYYHLLVEISAITWRLIYVKAVRTTFNFYLINIKISKLIFFEVIVKKQLQIFNFLLDSSHFFLLVMTIIQKPLTRIAMTYFTCKSQ